MTGMQMAAMSAGGYGVVTVTNQNPNYDQAVGTSATAQYGINSTKTVISTNEVVPNWLDVLGNVANFEVRMTQISGTALSSAPLSTWLSCSIDRLWSLTRSGVGVTVAQGTIEIRLASSGAVLGTATVSFSAVVS
jgi:hypothetical protein